MCNYCLEKGHWKRECPVLRGKYNKSIPKPVALASGQLCCDLNTCIDSDNKSTEMNKKDFDLTSDYDPFTVFSHCLHTKTECLDQSLNT